MKWIFVFLIMTQSAFAAVPPDEAIASMMNALNRQREGLVDRGVAGSDYNECVRISDEYYAKRCSVCKQWYSNSLASLHQCESQARRDAMERADSCREIELVHESNNKNISIGLQLQWKKKAKENEPTLRQMLKNGHNK